LEVLLFTRKKLHQGNRQNSKTCSKRPPRASLHSSTFSAKKTPENTEVEAHDPKPADGGDIQMEYFSDYLYRPSIGRVTKNDP
jgi:hypothetical protein